jgi:hypothetical protein
MDINNILKGKKVIVSTDAKVDVELVVEKAEEKINYKTIQITPDTPENDWWGRSETYQSSEYILTFENGLIKRYKSLQGIRCVE